MATFGDVNKQGQAMGRKGIETRRRFLDATKELLSRGPSVNLTPSGIARAARLASQTFYLYFEDVNELLLRLSEEAGEDMDEVLQELKSPRGTSSLHVHSSRFVKSFAAYWNRHREILNIRNFHSDNGNAEFMRVRRRAAMPIINAIAKRIRLADKEGLLAEKDALARSVVIYAAIERLVARAGAKQYGPRLLDEEDLLRAEAHILALLFAPASQAASLGPVPSSSRKPTTLNALIKKNGGSGSPDRTRLTRLRTCRSSCG